MNRRAILTAFVAQLKTIAPFRTVSCRLKHPDEIGDQPALYVIYDPGHYGPRVARGAPAAVTISAEIFIYYKPEGEPDEEFGFTGLDYMDALDKALGPDVFGRPQTLGDLVCDLRIEGETVLDPGHTSEQGRLYAPVKILIP